MNRVDRRKIEHFCTFFIFRDIENFEKKKYNILGSLYLVLGGTKWNIIQLRKWVKSGELLAAW